MSFSDRFSFARLWAMIVKEFIQMARDRLTFTMILGIPLFQLTVYGFVINTDPRHMPTAVILADTGVHGRTLLGGLKNSTYFDFVKQVDTEEEGQKMLLRGEIQFLVNIPENFSRDLLRGDRPAVLLVAGKANFPRAAVQMTQASISQTWTIPRVNLSLNSLRQRDEVVPNSCTTAVPVRPALGS